jgi:hypothetical protein
MSDDGGRAAHRDDDELEEDDEDFDPKVYETMLELERLESIEEEMADLGVHTLEDVRRRIRELHERLDQE